MEAEAKFLFKRQVLCSSASSQAPWPCFRLSTFGFSPLTTVIIFPINFTHKKREKIPVNNCCLFFERSSYLPKVSLRREHTRLSQGRESCGFQSASAWKHISDVQNIISMHLITRDPFLNQFTLHKPFLAPLQMTMTVRQCTAIRTMHCAVMKSKPAVFFFYLPDGFLSNQDKLFFFLSHSSLVVIVEKFSILPKMFHMMNY